MFAISPTRPRHVYAFLLNPQGHILGDLYAYHRGEDLLVDTDQSQREKILATFDHYIIMDDVEVADISDALTAIGCRRSPTQARYCTPPDCTFRNWSRCKSQISNGNRLISASSGENTPATPHAKSGSPLTPRK